jgi:hypothetical protein
MHFADKFGAFVRNPEPVMRMFHGELLTKQFVKRIQASLFLLQRP